MSKCVGCDCVKDNGEMYCHECDPDGELNHQASDPAVRAQIEKEKQVAALEAELAKLKGGSN
jgi:hypothetical protein